MYKNNFSHINLKGLWVTEKGFKVYISSCTDHEIRGKMYINSLGEEITTLSFQGLFNYFENEASFVTYCDLNYGGDMQTIVLTGNYSFDTKDAISLQYFRYSNKYNVEVESRSLKLRETIDALS